MMCRKPNEIIEDEKIAYSKLFKRLDFFHPWQCISLHLNNSTVDFVVKDKLEMYALINVLNVYIYKVRREHSK